MRHLPGAAIFEEREREGTRLHELCHATGAQHRLNRAMTGAFGSAKDAEEGIFAELSSSFIGTTLNLPTDIPNQANYIHHWLTRLKEELRFIFKAASAAQKIADWVLNLHPDYRAQAERPEDSSAVEQAQSELAHG
jgi:antirestriction protein ArdC